MATGLKKKKKEFKKLIHVSGVDEMDMMMKKLEFAEERVQKIDTKMNDHFFQ